MSTLIKKIEIPLAILLLALFFVREFDVAGKKSPTFDETAHLPAGYTYLTKGDFRMNIEHPPLVKMFAGLPLIFLGLNDFSNDPSWKNGDEWLYGYRFLNRNTVSVDSIILAGRIPVILLGILLGIFVFLWARRLYGVQAGLLSLFLYTFCPNILAHSCLVTTDLASACFMLLSLYAMWCYTKKDTTFNLIMAGMAFGLGIASKFSLVILLPIYACQIPLIEKNRLFQRDVLKKWLLFFVSLLSSAFLVLFILYLGKIGTYFKGFDFMFTYLANGHVSFLSGEYSVTGWKSYFISAFLWKTPIPFIIILGLLVVSSIVLWSKKEQTSWIFFFLPAFIIFLSGTFSHKQIGLRYILPMYPLLYVAAGKLTVLPSYFSKEKRKWISVCLISVLLVCVPWYGYSSLKIHPDYLAYFNEAVGGPDNGWKYLIDSNLDWGQDLKGLGEYLKTIGNPEITLVYFGTASPKSYGIKYKSFGFTGIGDPEDWPVNQNVVLNDLVAISATNLQSVYYVRHDLFDRFKNLPVKKKIGHSIFVYDISKNKMK